MKNFVISRKRLIFMFAIILLTITTGLYATYAINVYVEPKTPSTYDMALQFDLSNALDMSVTVGAGKFKAFDLDITNPYSDSVKYGVAYTATSPTTLPNGVIIAKSSRSKNAASGTVTAGSTAKVSIIVQNTSSSNITLTFSVINGYKNGGNLIVPSGKTLVTNEIDVDNFYAE